MYKKLIIAHPWLSDQAFIQASSEAGTMSASNLVRSMYPTDWWRTNGTTSAVLDIQLPALDWLQWDLVAPLYTNSGPEGTWQVLAANSQAGLDNPTFEDEVRPLWTVPDMERPGAPEWRHALRWLKNNVRTERWLRLVVTDPTARVPQDVLSPFLQWGRLYVALAWQPSYHRDKGAELTPADERGRRVRVQSGGDRIGQTARPRGPAAPVPVQRWVPDAGRDADEGV
jgi:hypothetical protein